MLTPTLTTYPPHPTVVAPAARPAVTPPMLDTRQTLEGTVGNTPLVRLRRITAHLPPSVAVYTKLEGFNPGGSVKDRAALNIIRVAERSGELTPDKVIVDATSGNTGIAYATFGAALGYRVRLYLPENATPERIKILRLLGAELILTDPLEGTDGAIEAVQAEVAAHPERYFYANQYDNPANWQAHYYTTAPEIIAQTEGRVTHFVAGLGTTGTLTGTGRGLKAYNPHIQVVAVQPFSPYHGLEGLKHIPTARRPHIYDDSVPDVQMTVETEPALAMTRRLAREEGIFAGISAGAAALAAVQLAETLDHGLVVTLFPDGGYKYLSESFWLDEQ